MKQLVPIVEKSLGNSRKQRVKGTRLEKATLKTKRPSREIIESRTGKRR